MGIERTVADGGDDDVTLERTVADGGDDDVTLERNGR